MSRLTAIAFAAAAAFAPAAQAATYFTGDTDAAASAFAKSTVTPYRHLDTGGVSGLMTSASTVPEPAAWTLMLAGFGAAAALYRSRRRSLRRAG